MLGLINIKRMVEMFYPWASSGRRCMKRQSAVCRLISLESFIILHWILSTRESFWMQIFGIPARILVRLGAKGSRICRSRLLWVRLLNLNFRWRFSLFRPTIKFHLIFWMRKCSENCRFPPPPLMHLIVQSKCQKVCPRSQVQKVYFSLKSAHNNTHKSCAINHLYTDVSACLGNMP